MNGGSLAIWLGVALLGIVVSATLLRHAPTDAPRPGLSNATSESLRETPESTLPRTGTARPDPSVAAQAADDEAVAALESEVARLAREVAVLAARLDTGLASDSPPDFEPQAAPPRGDPPETFFQAGMLVAAGLHPQDADELRERFERAELERLFVRDEAVRSGWYGTPRFRARQAELDRSLRSDLGEQDYDLVLYAAGRPNRVRIDHVLQDSPAAEEGIAPGDVLLRYDDRPLYSIRELRARSHEGVLGEPVEIDVLRDGRELFFRLPRGPLGVIPSSFRELPDLDR